MEAFIQRVHRIINICWDSFSAKVGGGLLEVNKEASMQLHFAYLLKNTMDLALHHKDEAIVVELETGIKVNGRMRACDIIIKMTKAEELRILPIELKCYKEYASSGGKRGAIDIFFKDVYADIELIESYATVENYINGIQLTMTDFVNVVHPKVKKGKYFDYDITDGASIKNGVHLQTEIGGKEVDIKIKGSYDFNWKQVGSYYFLKLMDKDNGGVDIHY